MSYLTLKNIHKFYNVGSAEGIHALRGVTLNINHGEMISIMGPSGSGKSTLLHILGCLDSPTDGEYYINGKLVSGLNDRKLADIRNKQIGFILQDFGLMNDRTVVENVAVPLLFNKSVPWRNIEKKAYSIMEKLEIIELVKRRICDLSGGQKQRVAIARALVNDPQTILADEPTGSLDTKLTEEIASLLKQLNQQGRTVIIVTHNPNIGRYCQKSLSLIDGMIM